MRTRTRTDSPVGQRLDLSWDTPSADNTPPVETSIDKVKKPQDTSRAPSEPVSPIPSMEKSPASLNSTENSTGESPFEPAANGEVTSSSTGETSMQNNPEAAPSTTAVAADLSSATKYPAEAGFSSAFTSPSLPSQTDEKPFSPPPSTVPADNPATFPVSDSLSTPASDALAKAEEVLASQVNG